MAATVTAADVRRARDAIAGAIERTPALERPALAGGDGRLVLKAESLQRTGSFKLRGALSKIAALGDGAADGVVAGSAGNHAWAVAAAAGLRGLACEVFMPVDAPLAKVEGCTALGAVVTLTGASVEESVAAARERATTMGMTFIHPYDDADVVAGQGTIGLELLEDVPGLAKVLVPVGGGGLASGVAIAVKSERPDVEVVGVRVERLEAARTIADGIAVKAPGELTGALLRQWVDTLVTVTEDEVGEAMALLLDRAKLVVEGAGAVAVAALLAGRAAAAPEGATVAILSGGNVDPGLLASIARRHETVAGRRLVLFTRVGDRPGMLAGLLTVIAQAGANLLGVEHLREGLRLHVRETGVQLVLETRGSDHADAVLRAVHDAGYDARVLD